MNPAPHTPGPDSAPPRDRSRAARAGLSLARQVAAAGRAAAGARARALGRRAGRAWGRRPSSARAVAILFLAAAAGLGATGVLFRAGLPGRLPTAIDWAALGALLERDARPGDAVVVSPGWAERARQAVPPRVPVLAHASLAGEAPTGVRRVWLVALPDAPRFSWEAELALLSRAHRDREPPLRLGGLEVTRLDLGAPLLPLAFLPDRLAGAEVRRGEAACAPDPAGGFSCEGGARLERTVREVAGAPRPCLVISGAAPGEALAIAFRGIPVGRTLGGHAGVPAGAEVVAARLGVRVDGEDLGSVEVSGAGWRPFRLDTSRAAGRSRELVLLVATPAAAPLCLEAVTLP